MKAAPFPAALPRQRLDSRPDPVLCLDLFADRDAKARELSAIDRQIRDCMNAWAPTLGYGLRPEQFRALLAAGKVR